MSGVSMTAAQFSEKQRDRLAQTGVAMRDGSFPIRNKSDLKNAVMAFGRASNKAATKRHIVKRARALGAVDALPESWGITVSLVASSKNARKRKIDKVMAEFKAGTLKSSDGTKVTDRKQALAIALSMAREITAAGFDESKHPRHEKGSKGGGQFKPKVGDMVETPHGPQEVVSANDERRIAFTRTPGVEEPPTSIGYEHLSPASEGDPDQELFDEIEAQAQPYIEQGYEPSDSEPGEWLELTHPGTGNVVTIDEDGVHDGGIGAEMDDGEVDPYATDYDEAGGDAVQLSPQEFVDQERQQIADRVARGELTTAEGQQLTEQAWAEYQRRKGQTASALTAAAAGLAPEVPPKSWFEKPKLDGPTPITVTADGRIYGHAALWGTCHTGISGVCRTPPRSQSDYQFFHLGEVDTDGGPVHVGRVTMNTGHAPLTASRDATVRHYDDTGTSAAHVRAYEDEHGIVLAGAVMPDLSATDARRLKGAPVSGDWRSIGGKLELVGMLAVNVPGFPVPRAMAASLIVEDEPHTMAMVAAGMYCNPKEYDRKIKALTARAQGVDGLAALALGGTVEERRRRALRASS